MPLDRRENSEVDWPWWEKIGLPDKVLREVLAGPVPGEVEESGNLKL